MPILYLFYWRRINDIQDNLLGLISEFRGLFNCRVIKVIFVAVSPVHLLHSHRKQPLIFWIHLLLSHSEIMEFIEVEASCVAVVEDKRVAVRLGANVVSFVIRYDLEKLLVKGIGFKEVFSDFLFQVRVVLEKEGL